LVRGEHKACFGVTEPTTGLDTTRLKTRAVRHGDRYLVDGQKVWISTAQVATHILLLARTTPLDAVGKPADGTQPVLHPARPHPRPRFRDPEDGPRRRGLERDLLRGLRDPGRGPHRRGRAAASARSCTG
jgi:alkylation response protein AidB-like acyl-CoA dehydrogenase